MVSFEGVGWGIVPTVTMMGHPLTACTVYARYPSSLSSFLFFTRLPIEGAVPFGYTTCDSEGRAVWL